MISRRDLFAGAGAVVAAGGGIVLAIKSTMHTAQDRTARAPNFSVSALDGKTRHWSNLAHGYMAEARGLFGGGRGTAQAASARIEGRA